MDSSSTSLGSASDGAGTTAGTAPAPAPAASEPGPAPAPPSAKAEPAPVSMPAESGHALPASLPIPSAETAAAAPASAPVTVPSVLPEPQASGSDVNLHSSDAADTRPTDVGPSRIAATGAAPTTSSQAPEGGSTRRPPRRASRPSARPQLADASTGMVTRQAQAAAGSKAPRFKVKMSKGDQGSAPKNAAYMQGYNRELDSSDDEGEGIAFEEQLIFRMPAGKDCDKLREMVKNREVGEAGATEVSLEFKDSRRAVFKFGSSRFSAKLVDLPTITESHKILDNKQMFKVADISQMLLIEEKLFDEDLDAGAGSTSGSQRTQGIPGAQTEKGFDIDDFIYPHGITPPMHWARKRRFRKRANKRNIETVEKEVERLLEEDEFAEKTEYEVIDEAALDHMSDSEMGDNAASVTAATPRPMSEDGDSQAGDLLDKDKVRSDKNGDGEEDEEEPEEDEVDEDLAAALDAALEEAEEEETDSEDGDADGERDGERHGAAAEDDDDAEEEEEEDDEDEEQAEQRIRVNQLEAECREIDTLVKRKQADVDRAANPMIKQRLDRSLKTLQAELESKRAQLLALRQEREHRKEEAAQAEAEAEEERNRQEEEKEKEALAQAEAATDADATKDGADPGQSKDATTGTSQPTGAVSSTASERAKGSKEAAKAGPSRASTLKDVLIGDASRAASNSQPQSQRQSGTASAADSPAAEAVPMDVDQPGEAPQRLSVPPQDEDEDEEEEDAEEDGDAGAAPNEDSDAEDDEGLWS